MIEGVGSICLEVDPNVKINASTLNWARMQTGSQLGQDWSDMVPATHASHHLDCSIMHQLKFLNAFQGQPHLVYCSNLM